MIKIITNVTHTIYGKTFQGENFRSSLPYCELELCNSLDEKIIVIISIGIKIINFIIMIIVNLWILLYTIHTSCYAEDLKILYYYFIEIILQCIIEIQVFPLSHSPTMNVL